MPYLVLKFKKIFNMSHQKTKNDCFLFFSFLLGFSSQLFIYHLNAFNWKTNIFLLNMGTIKDKDGLLFLVPANTLQTQGLDLSTLKDMLFVKSLFSMENPLWPVLVKFSHFCPLYWMSGRGKERILSNSSTLFFYLNDSFNNFSLKYNFIDILH